MALTDKISENLDELLLIKGKGFVRKSDNIPVSITDGDKFVTYCSVNDDFSSYVKKDISTRDSDMPKGVNGFLIHGAVPLDRNLKNTRVQLDYYAFAYTIR